MHAHNQLADIACWTFHLFGHGACLVRGACTHRRLSCCFKLHTPPAAEQGGYAFSVDYYVRLLRLKEVLGSFESLD